MKILLTFLSVLSFVSVAIAQPAFPTNVVVKLKQDGSVSLAWDKAASHTNVVFTVLTGIRSGIYNTRTEAGTNLTTTVTNLPPGATYFFVVIARNTESQIESDPSNEVSLFISPKPITPSNLNTTTIRAFLEDSRYPTGPWSTAVAFPAETFLASADRRFFRVRVDAALGPVVRP